MARQDGYMEYPDGTHLSQSRDSDGGLSALARDEDNNLVAHATFHPTEGEDEGDELDAEGQGFDPKLIAAFLAGAAAVFGGKLAWSWWQESGRQKVNELTRGRPRRSKRSSPADAGAAIESGQDPQPAEVEVTNPAPSERPRITEAEATQLLIEAIRSRCVSDELLAFLRGAEIVDSDAPEEVEAALQQLTPEQLEPAVRKFLAANPGVLEANIAQMTQLGFQVGMTPFEPDPVSAQALESVPEDEEDR